MPDNPNHFLMKNIVFPFAFIGVTAVLFFTKPGEQYCKEQSIAPASEIVAEVLSDNDPAVEKKVKALTLEKGIVVKDRLLFQTIYLRVKGQYRRLGVAGLNRVFLF